VYRIEGFKRTYFLLNTPLPHHSHNSCVPWFAANEGDGTFRLGACCSDGRSFLVSEGDDIEQVTSGNGEGEMDEVEDNASHAIVMDILMGTWGTYKEH
jgi:hypothetical protein